MVFLLAFEARLELLGRRFGSLELLEGRFELGLLELKPIRHKDTEVVPRDFFIDVVSPRIRNPEGKDLVALRVVVSGTKDGDASTVQYDLLDYLDAENHVTAMMRTTGYSLAVTSLMQVDGRVTEKGVHTPDEAMPAEAYISELADRGIRIERTNT